MRRFVCCLLPAVLVLALPVPPAVSAPEQRGPTAVWVWSLQPAVELRDFARSHRLVEVFLATPVAPTDAEARRIRRTVRLLHDDGVLVAALGGAKSWVRRHNQAMTWARAALDSADFDGLHLDVEPHGLPGWAEPDTQAGLVRDYLDLLDDVRPLSDRIVVDVQFAYGSVEAPGAGSFADSILDRVDGVTVMSYRDTARGPNSVLDISRDWLRRAARANVPVQLAVETRPAVEGEHVTFAEEGRSAMLRVIGIVDSELRGTGTYSGVAVHDLDGWRALAP